MDPVQVHSGHSGNYEYAHAWIEDVRSTTSGQVQLVFVTMVIAFVSEAISALYERTRDRPLGLLSNMMVCVVLHNLLASVLYGVRLGLMLILMIVWMELEPWLCAAVVMGAALGHLLCRWTTMWKSDRYQKYELEPLTKK